MYVFVCMSAPREKRGKEKENLWFKKVVFWRFLDQEMVFILQISINFTYLWNRKLISLKKLFQINKKFF